MRAKELLTLARRDEGMAILGAICSVLVLLSMLLAATTCADLLAARQRAAAAADVAALAAAPDAVLSPEDACVRAREIASRNDALLISCQVQNEEVVVRAVASPRTNWARWIEHVVSDSTDPSVSARATMSEAGLAQ
jgi:secretion/DNA translocation related TadE-like protein